jgi:hypothetical protein
MFVTSPASLRAANSAQGGAAGSGSGGGGDGRAGELVLRSVLRAADSPRLNGEDLDHVGVLAEEGVCWPPIVVHRQSMRVIDGMHRLRAAQLRGQVWVEVEFFDGDELEAFVLGVRANVAHGLPLTLADRRAAAGRILGWVPDRSDRWIGEVTGLAPATVGAIRRRSGGAGVGAVVRTGRDGRVRPVDPAAGRRRAQEEIARRPGASLREIARAAGISPATAKLVRDRLACGEHGPGRARGGVGRRPAAGRRASPAGCVQVLMSDPSLRNSDSGRSLLRLLDAQARGLAQLKTVVDSVPGHCGYVLAEMARACAAQWLDLATTLERARDNECEATASTDGPIAARTQSQQVDT